MKMDATAKQAEEGGTAESAFGTLAAPLVDEAIARAAALRHDHDPEVLHKLRVALRQLRSLWWAYSPLLDKGMNSRERALYQYLANAAGKTRDWDILIALLSTIDKKPAAKSASDAEGAADPLAQALQESRASALSHSLDTLTHTDIRTMLHEAVKTANRELNTAPTRTSMRKFAKRRVAAARHTLDKRIRRAVKAKRSEYPAFHDVRKAGKKLRYLIEFFGPVLGCKQRNVVKKLKKIQKRFGALNDVVASEALLRENPALVPDGPQAREALASLQRERKRRMRAASKLLRKC